MAEPSKSTVRTESYFGFGFTYKPKQKGPQQFTTFRSDTELSIEKIPVDFSYNHTEEIDLSSRSEDQISVSTRIDTFERLGVDVTPGVGFDYFWTEGFSERSADARLTLGFKWLGGFQIGSSGGLINQGDGTLDHYSMSLSSKDNSYLQEWTTKPWLRLTMGRGIGQQRPKFRLSGGLRIKDLGKLLASTSTTPRDGVQFNNWSATLKLKNSFLNGLPGSPRGRIRTSNEFDRQRFQASLDLNLLKSDKPPVFSAGYLSVGTLERRDVELTVWLDQILWLEKTPLSEFILCLRAST